MKKTFGSDKPRRFAPSGDKKFGGKPGFGPKKKFGEDRPRGPAGSGDRRPDGDRPAWKSDKPAYQSSRPEWKSDRPSGGSDNPRRSESSGERRPYGDRPAWKSDRPAFKSDRPAWKSDRPGGGDKPRYSDSSGSGERRPYGDKPAWKSDKPAFKSDRPAWKSDRPGGGDKPRYSDSSGSGERRPYGDKPAWKSDKPAFKSDRPAWKSDRPGGGDKPRYSDSSGSGERRSYGDKPAWKSDKPAFKSDRPAWNSDRPGGGDKPRYSDSSGSGERRSYGDKPAWKSDKPAFKSDRPAWKSDRPGGGDKPRYSDSSGSGERRPYGDKPAWKSDKPAFKSDRPAWKSDRPGGGGDKPRYSDSSGSGERRPYGDKPAWKSDKPDFQADRPVWKPEGPMDPDRPARDKVVSVPYNKKNFDEASSRPDFAGKTFSKGSRPTYNPQTDAKSLIVTLDDTNNVPVRLVWIYDSMVGELPDGEPSAGDTVFVYDQNNRFTGSAIYNPNSRIRARIFSLTRRKFDEAYLREAIEKAISTRKQLGLLNESCRAISGEGDGIPGLIADKIGDYLVIQPLTYAVNRHLAFIVDQLNSQLAPGGIVVRKDVPIRAKEGLSVEEPTIHGEVPERVKVVEEGCIMFANPAGGQKTGLFLDQRLNRAVLKPFCKDARVLDLFCHVGGWAMRAAKYGAAEVIGVDSSESALELATSGATANGFDNVSFVEDDVFEYLRKLDSEPESLFDVIVCDPPAFAKTRAHYEEAFRAYLSLNYLVMKKLKPGGVLITCSCSQAVSTNEFNEALLTSARNARMQFQVIEKRGAPQDHPVLLGLPESEYLKCFVMRRIE